ncbi:MAG: DUF5615 family PIN-like protein [Chloroflexota bacterium]|nr:DUF5615 family PIN-like protein [Chloroflexota bacterium]
MRSIYQGSPGLDDSDVLSLAVEDDRILITADKDFGEMVFRERRLHKGIILLRLADERSSNKLEVLNRLFQQHSDHLPDNFVVVTESTVRINGTRPS